MDRLGSLVDPKTGKTPIKAIHEREEMSQGSGREPKGGTVHPHEDLLRREAEAGIQGGSLAEDFYTDDHVLHYPGKSPVAGEYRGHEGLAEFGRRLAALASVRPELHDVLGNDDHGVQLVSVQAERKDGSRHAWRVMWVFHFRDGKISESWAHIDDQQALDDFLSL